MADSYMIGDVTVAPQGGGYYDLTTPGGEKARLRGKQKAEEAAANMASPKGDPDVTIPEQPDLDVAIAQQSAPTSPEVTTVRVTDGEQPADRVPVGRVPNQFTGTMPKTKKEALAKIGVKTSCVILEENESIPPTGLFVGHNGRSYMIVPGEEVDVPDFVLEVLDNAVMSTPVVDQKTRRVLGYRNRSKYPYRRV